MSLNKTKDDLHHVTHPDPLTSYFHKLHFRLILELQVDMDMSPAWLSEIEIEDTVFNMDYDRMSKLVNPIDNSSADILPSEFYTENMMVSLKSFQPQRLEIKLPNVQENCSSINKTSPTPEPLIATSLPSSNTFTITFGDIDPKDQILQFHDSIGDEDAGTTKVSTMARKPIQVRDHVLQERKRREIMNQHFISLSALLPNFKKTAKACLLEDASKYIKELEERVKELDRLSRTTRHVQESVISITRSTNNTSGDECLSSYEPNSRQRADSCRLSPEIEVRISGSSVLVRIQGQKNICSLVKVLNHMQMLGLSIISSSAMPFAMTTLLINIVAQIEDDFCMTATELVKNLKLAL